MMDLLSKILVIGAGGGFGAAIRHMLAGILEGGLNLPAFAAVMGVNVLGAFLIGFVLVLAGFCLKYDYRNSSAVQLKSEQGKEPEVVAIEIPVLLDLGFLSESYA